METLLDVINSGLVGQGGALRVASHAALLHHGGVLLSRELLKRSQKRKRPQDENSVRRP